MSFSAEEKSIRNDVKPCPPRCYILHTKIGQCLVIVQKLISDMGPSLSSGLHCFVYSFQTRRREKSYIWWYIYWVARNQRTIVLLYPYISINVDNEKSAYSLLVSYFSFRDESELVPAQFVGSAIAALRARLSSDSPTMLLPFAIRNRISHRKNMQGVVDAINTRNANLDFDRSQHSWNDIFHFFVFFGVIFFVLHNTTSYTAWDSSEALHPRSW